MDSMVSSVRSCLSSSLHAYRHSHIVTFIDFRLMWPVRNNPLVENARRLSEGSSSSETSMFRSEIREFVCIVDVTIEFATWSSKDSLIRAEHAVVSGGRFHGLSCLSLSWVYGLVLYLLFMVTDKNNRIIALKDYFSKLIRISKSFH